MARHLVMAVLLCWASGTLAARPALRVGSQLQRWGASEIAEQDQLALGLLGANAITSEASVSAVASTDSDRHYSEQRALNRGLSRGLSELYEPGAGPQDPTAAARSAAASAWRSIQRGIISWARTQPAGSSTKTKRARRTLPGATWTLYPLIGGGEEAAAAEFQDGEELERTGKAEGQLKATAVAAVDSDQKPYNAQDYAAQRAAAWERAVTGSE